MTMHVASLDITVWNGISFIKKTKSRNFFPKGLGTLQQAVDNLVKLIWRNGVIVSIFKHKCYYYIQQRSERGLKCRTYFPADKYTSHLAEKCGGKYCTSVMEFVCWRPREEGKIPEPDREYSRHCRPHTSLLLILFLFVCLNNTVKM